MLWLLPMLNTQFLSLVQRVPEIFSGLWEEYAAPVSSFLGSSEEPLGKDWVLGMLERHGSALVGVADSWWQYTSESGKAALWWLSCLALIPVVAFYLMRDWNRLLRHCVLWAPTHRREVLCQLARGMR